VPMKISKIEFENFRNFKERGQIRCSTDGKVTIIYGRIGDGKTTLHQLVQWVFYGRVRFNKTATDRLYNLQYENDCSFGDTFDVMGCVDFEHDGVQYSLRRTYTYRKGLSDSVKIAEDLALTKMDEDYNWRRIDKPNSVIETLLPSGLSDYFFFDGETMIADLRVKGKDSAGKLRKAYESKDPIALITKKTVDSIPFLRKYTDKEKDNLSKYSSNIFTLNTFQEANKRICKVIQDPKKAEKLIHSFWNNVVINMREWNEMDNGELSKKSLREDYIITQGLIILALGRLCEFFCANPEIHMAQSLKGLKKIDWLRNNEECWMNRAIKPNGKINRNEQGIFLTYIQIKRLTRMRTPVGYIYKTPVRFHCGECDSLLTGEFITDNEKVTVKYVPLNCEEVDPQDCEYFGEASGEMLCSKINAFHATGPDIMQLPHGRVSPVFDFMNSIPEDDRIRFINYACYSNKMAYSWDTHKIKYDLFLKGKQALLEKNYAEEMKTPLKTNL